MVAKYVEAKSIHLCPQLRFSADFTTINPNNQWNHSWYKVLKPRSAENIWYHLPARQSSDDHPRRSEAWRRQPQTVDRL